MGVYFRAVRVKVTHATPGGFPFEFKLAYGPVIHESENGERRCHNLRPLWKQMYPDQETRIQQIRVQPPTQMVA